MSVQPASQWLKVARAALQKGEYQQSFDISQYLISDFHLSEDELFHALRNRAWSLIYMNKRDEAKQGILDHLSKIRNQWVKTHLKVVFCLANYYREV